MPQSISIAEPITYSIVIAAYNEAEVLPALHARLARVLDTLDGPGEIIVVNDGSHDETLEVLRRLRAVDPRVKIVNLARNFGHELAMLAGLDHSRGAAIIPMDADLQDPPEVIPDLAARWREGFEVVYAVRNSREHDNPFKRYTASAFYRIMNLCTGNAIPNEAGNFRLMSRRALDAVLAMREQHRFFRAQAHWVGFSRSSVTFERPARFAGETKYSTYRMVRLALDGLLGFSTMPLKLATSLGFGILLLGVLLLVWQLVKVIGFGSAFSPGASFLLVVLFLGAVQLICLGILGEYLSRIYDEVRRRPLYVVQETEGIGEEGSQLATAANTNIE